MTSAAPRNPNSSPMIAKMKSLKAFGRNSRRRAALAEPRPEQAAEPEREQPLDGVEAGARARSAHGSSQARMRSIW